MAVEQDPRGWLPEPPPPRPARRDAAIDAALRRFDGLPDAPAAASEGPRRSWASTHRPQLAVAFSALLLVIIFIPAALIGLRNAPPPSKRAASRMVAQDRLAPPPAPAQRPPADADVAQAPPSGPQPGETPPLGKDQSEERQVVTNDLPAAPAQADRVEAAPAPAPARANELAEAAPPPPPPPPPPPSPTAAPSSLSAKTADAQDVGRDAAAQDIVVTGARISQSTPYAAFVPRLQAAVRADDRRALLGLIGFPLRVNGAAGAKIYRDRRSVERDFVRIFTPKVRQAILDQAPNALFVRDQDAMIGDGEVWIAQTCPNEACSPAGAVRIIAVNP
jgi:hypothetical protein